MGSATINITKGNGKSPDSEENGSKVSNGFPWGKRHWLILLGFVGLFNIYTMRICLSMAIVAMVAPIEPKTDSFSIANFSFVDGKNSSLPKNSPDVCPEPEGMEMGKRPGNSSESPRFAWDTQTQGIILGSYFYGYIVTQLAGGWLSKHYGGKYPFGIGILISGVLTSITPIASSYHYGALIAVRIGEGLSTGLCYPSMQHMLSVWSPARERTKLSTLVNAGAPVGNVVVLALSGVIADNLGWESIFYVFGGVTCFWFIFWQLFAYDSPEKHPNISEAELTLITGRSKIQALQLRDTSQSAENSKKPSVPWKKILSSTAVWALILSHFGQNWGNYTLLTNLPTYMKNILRFELSANGLFSALPYLALWLFGVASGYISDFIRQRHLMSTTNVRKMFNTLGNIVPIGALIAVGYAGCDWVAAIVLLTLSTGFSGFTQSSFQVNSLDLSPAYASIIYGVSNTFANVPGIVSPYTVGLITAGPDGQTLFNWRIIFFISAGVRCFTMIAYAIFASGEVMTWNYSGDTEPVGLQ